MGVLCGVIGMPQASRLDPQSQVLSLSAPAQGQSSLNGRAQDIQGGASQGPEESCRCRLVSSWDCVVCPPSRRSLTVVTAVLRSWCRPFGQI